MIRAAVIAVLMLTAAVTGAVAFDHYRPKPVQQVILQPVHTVERIVERHTVKRIKSRASGAQKMAPARGKRYPGDDSANELNLRELRYERYQ